MVTAQSDLAPLRKTRKVLIIDNEDDLRVVAAAALEFTAGWQTLEASTGLEGIDCARRELPDVILLDVQMPGMNGPDVLTCLQNAKELSAIPIVFLTARVGAGERKQLMERGAVAVLPKPFDPLTLARDLAAVLGWSDA